MYHSFIYYAAGPVGPWGIVKLRTKFGAAVSLDEIYEREDDSEYGLGLYEEINQVAYTGEEAKSSMFEYVWLKIIKTITNGRITTDYTLIKDGVCTIENTLTPVSLSTISFPFWVFRWFFQPIL